MKRLFLIAFVIVALLTAVTPCLSAQRMGGAHFSGGPGFGRPNSAFSRFGGYSLPFYYPFADSLYADYLPAGYPMAPQPPVIFVQTSPTTAPSPLTQSIQPLMIELQGDRYVRVREEDSPSAEQMKSQDQGSGAKSAEVITHPVVAREMPSAILVFRDGHREEASEYTITGGVLYSRSNYYIDGSWTRKINLSSLNLPETIASNQSRGVHFELPNSPNEVVVGP